MNFTKEVTGRVMLGMGLGMQLAETYPAIEAGLAHNALVLEEDRPQAPALPPLVAVELNRRERRFLKLPAVRYVHAETPEHTDLLNERDRARKDMRSRSQLIRYGHQIIR